MSNANTDRFTDQSTLFDDFIEDYLDHQVRGVQVRPIDFDDLADLARGEAPNNFEAYYLDSDGRLSPVIVAVTMHDAGVSCSSSYALNPGTGRLDRSMPIGFRFRVGFQDAFGERFEGTLYTTPEAESSGAHAHDSVPSKTRVRLFLPEGSPVGTEAGKPFTYMETVAVHGAEVSLRCVVAGMSPAALRARIEEMMDEEFGSGLSALKRLTTRAVYPKRVDVFDADSGSMLAVNVLATEAHYLRDCAGTGAIETRPANTSIVVGR